MSMLASTLFAKAISKEYLLAPLGKEECHWCGGPCTQRWHYDGILPLPLFAKDKERAKRPSRGYICAGCWLWRRRRVTVDYLHGGSKDGQCAMDHSWWIGEEGAFAVLLPQSGPALLEKLLKPPLRFALSLISEPKLQSLCAGERPYNLNRLHWAIVNDNVKVEADQPLAFTLNASRYEYTVYELKEAIAQRDTMGRIAGVRELIALIGYPEIEEKQQPQRGRPHKEMESGKKTKQLIVASGIVIG